MYRLMKSEKFTLNYMVAGSRTSYRQIQINEFLQFSKALTACNVANRNVGPSFYILNDSGQEFYADSWID